MNFTKDDILFATSADIDDWMELVSLMIDGYPCLNEAEYMENLHQYIADNKALILRDEGIKGAALGTGIGYMIPTVIGTIFFLTCHCMGRRLPVAGAVAGRSELHECF